MTPDVSQSDAPIILNLRAQWSPSRPGTYSRYYPQTIVDSVKNRQQWFQECLDILDTEIPTGEVVAMPDHIGCGLAGGDWNTYKAMLQKCQTSIKLYKL